MTETPPLPLPLAEAHDHRCYQAPTAIDLKSATRPSQLAPAHIQLRLETGHELDIPVTQHAIDALYRVLKSMTTKP